MLTLSITVFLFIVSCRAPLESINSVVDEERPNLMIILVDDLGYGDLGCYGSPIIQTPNLNKLASEGLRLTNCYSSSPMCSPSRAGMLTGRVPYRTGVSDWIAPDSTMYLPKKEVTIATLLQQDGYQTSHVGKWHLNGKFNTEEQPQPGDHGFESWFGCQYSLKHLDPEGFYDQGQPIETKGYACDIVSDKAVDWLKNKRNKEQSFFQYVNFLEPHEPIMSPADLVEDYAEYENKAEYFANVQNLDRAIGRIIGALDSLGLSENTLVFFTSDNGPAQYTPKGHFNKSHGSAGPLRGYKRHMFDGGIRVPGIFRWKGRIKEAQLNEQPVCNVDILPTFCKLVGVKVPNDRILDGTDISPVFDGLLIERQKPLHWHFYDPWGGPQSLMRDGDYMLGSNWDVGDFHHRGRFDPMEVEVIKKSKLATFQLYNLADDIHQDIDLVNKLPELADRMSNQLKGLHKEVMEEAPYITK